MQLIAKYVSTYLSVPMHLNWKGMLQVSGLFVGPNSDERLDPLLEDAVHATTNAHVSSH